MMLVCVLLGGLGVVGILFKRNLLSILVGLQLLALGAGAAFVFSSSSGHIYGFFIALTAVAQLVVGFSLAIRVFYLKRRIEMADLRSLKH